MINLRNISYTYKSGTKALTNINLEINAGEVTMIIGKNGSGKSTLGNVIAKIFNCHSGTISIDDNIINNKTKMIDIRKKIGIVFQNPNNQIIFNRVYDDIAFTLNNLKVSQSKIENIIKQSLDDVDMVNYMYSNPYELSLGQKQRVAIASALAANPSYIVLDEATSMLDAKGKKDIYNIIKNLAKRNIGVIFITNIMDEILLADKLVIIDKGKIVKVLKRDEIIDNIKILSDIGLEVPFIVKVILTLKEKNIRLNNLEENEILSIINKELSK